MPQRPAGVTADQPGATDDGNSRVRHSVARSPVPLMMQRDERIGHNGGMNLIAIILGIIAILIVIVTAILPVIGAIFSWLALVIGVIGLVFGLLSNNTSGRNISILACVLAAFRLALGGGVL
jgi:hypothetical protein